MLGLQGALELSRVTEKMISQNQPQSQQGNVVMKGRRRYRGEDSSRAIVASFTPEEGGSSAII